MNKEIINKDLVIIGGGPAGISAGIYAAMGETDFYLLEKKECCWFMKESINSHHTVDGFTGSSNNITGTDLQKSFLSHYRGLGGGIVEEAVIGLTKKNNLFLVETDKKTILAKTVIIASGASPKSIDIKNIDKFKEHVHYQCTEDGGKYAGQDVLTIGGRNSGAVAACYLYDLGCRPTLIEIKDELQAKQKYQDWIKKRNIRVMTSSVVMGLHGKDNLLESAVISNKGNNIEIPTKGVFLYAGRAPNLDYCRLNILRDGGYIITNEKNQTSIGGLFAAGDITCRLKQVITACGDGANAYYFAKKYIDKITEG